MKKKTLFVAMAFAALAAAGIAVADSNPSGLSDVQLANIEALSNGEANLGDRIKCYSSLKYESGSSVVECSTCRSKENSTDRWYSYHDHCIVRWGS